MSLLDSIKSKLSGMSIIQKIMAVVLFPITIIGLILKLKGAIDSFSEDSKRKQVDDKSKDLDEKISETSKKISKEEGKLEALEEAKDKAVDAADQQDPVSFHNSRKKK